MADIEKQTSLLQWGVNQDKSAARFCQQLATLVTDMFCNFNLVINHKIANNPTTPEAR